MEGVHVDAFARIERLPRGEDALGGVDTFSPVDVPTGDRSDEFRNRRSVELRVQGTQA